MSERRMFAKAIVNSDAFLDMSLSSQALYFHLALEADDDGFVNNPKRIQRTIGAAEDDLKLLIAKRFILAFDSGVIVIKHWKIHNYIRRDRHRPTQYQNEFSSLLIKDSGAYTEAVRHLSDICQPNVSIGKNSIGKNSIGKFSLDKNSNHRGCYDDDEEIEIDEEK